MKWLVRFFFLCVAVFVVPFWGGADRPKHKQKYKSKTTSGTGFFNILPILEQTLTASISTGQYRPNESKVEG
jgi:hypothetical protein